MRIKKFEEFISEGLWNKGLNRSKLGSVRKEDGTKVNTTIGEVILHNTKWDYDSFIEDLFNYDDNGFYVLHYDGAFTSEEKMKIKNGEDNYLYYINEHQGLLMESYMWSDLSIPDDFEKYGDDIEEDDYINIMKLVAKAYKKTSIIEGDVDKDEMLFVILDTYDDEIYKEFDGDCSLIYENFEEFLKYFNIKFGKNNLQIRGDNDFPTLTVDITFDAFQRLNEMKQYAKKYFFQFITK